jgi:hypothetical protein
VAKVTADHLAKLQQKADQHNAKLQAAKARLADTERKLDTRRKIIAGGLLFDAASKDKQWARHLSVLQPSKGSLSFGRSIRNSSVTRLDRGGLAIADFAAFRFVLLDASRAVLMAVARSCQRRNSRRNNTRKDSVFGSGRLRAYVRCAGPRLLPPVSWLPFP